MNTVDERTTTTHEGDTLTIQGLLRLSPISNPNPEEDWEEPPFVDLTIRSNGTVYRACVLKLRPDKETGREMHEVHLYDAAGEPLLDLSRPLPAAELTAWYLDERHKDIAGVKQSMPPLTPISSSATRAFRQHSG